MEDKYRFSREEVVMVLSKYVSNERLVQFIKDHESQIADLQRGGISGVFSGFQKRMKPDETYDARISLKRNEDKETGKTFITPAFTFKNKTLKIPASITLDGVQIQLTEQQCKELSTEGRLSETLKFTGQNGIHREIFLAVDRELNRIAFMPANYFRAPEKIYNCYLDQEQKKTLSSGKKIQIEIDFKNGKQTMLAYYDPILHKIKFEKPANGKNGNIPIPAEKQKPSEKITDSLHKSDDNLSFEQELLVVFMNEGIMGRWRNPKFANLYIDEEHPFYKRNHLKTFIDKYEEADQQRAKAAYENDYFLTLEMKELMRHIDIDFKFKAFKQLIKNDIPIELRRNELTEEWRNIIREESNVKYFDGYLGEVLVDKNGKQYKGYFIIDKETGKIGYMTSKEYKATIAAIKETDDRQKTQAINNSGKKTIEVSEKLKGRSIQSQPTEKQQENIKQRSNKKI